MGKKVLIVDDEQNIVISLDFLLSSSGYEPVSASNGREAYESLDSGSPDLVLLDIMLPDCTGFDICQYIRSNPKFDKTKIVLLTARGMEKDIEKGIAMGADAYIVKPFSTKDLVKKIGELLGSGDEKAQ